MKKFLVIFLAVAVLVSVFLNIFSRKAPEMLRQSIERSLGKAVKIRAIEFHFPWNFELSGVEVRDKSGVFKGEICFVVDQIHLTVSPLSLSRKDLVIDRFDVRDATVTVRKREGRLYHVLSATMGAGRVSEGSPPPPSSAKESHSASLPLTIHQFQSTDGKFEFVDYDVSPEGFVIRLDQIRSLVREIHLPSNDRKTSYRIEARLPQDRDEKAGNVQLNGWTVFSDDETEALMTVNGLHLPYFAPYLAQVTPAQIQDGTMDSRLSLTIQKRLLTANADLEASSLYFGSYEDGNQLFGLKADEILSFLKDASGRLKFHLVAQWDLADKNVKKSDVIRRSIEQSLKKTVLGNLGNFLENTLKKIGDRGLDGLFH